MLNLLFFVWIYKTINFANGITSNNTSTEVLITINLLDPLFGVRYMKFYNVIVLQYINC